VMRDPALRWRGTRCPETQTEGGEALNLGGTTVAQGTAEWRVLWTKSHCEQLVHDQLVGAGFDPFLPKIEVWSRRGGVRHRIDVPMFAGYFFLGEPLDRARHVQVKKTRGLVGILGESWDAPDLVPETEIQAIRRIVDAGLGVSPHPYLREGQRVRMVDGPLRDVSGVLVRYDAPKGLLVLSIEMLQRSVAVEVDCTHVVPA
jgi:transcription termination/antitermination protein NusG